MDKYRLEFSEDQACSFRQQAALIHSEQAPCVSDSGASISPGIQVKSELGTVGIDKGDQGQVSIHIGILIQTFFRVARVPGSPSQICKNLRALGDINQFEILQYISGKQAYGMELAKEFSLTTVTISKHMSMLRACGLINVEKRNDNRVYFSVNQQAIVQLLDDVRSCLIK